MNFVQFLSFMDSMNAIDATDMSFEMAKDLKMVIFHCRVSFRIFHTRKVLISFLITVIKFLSVTNSLL